MKELQLISKNERQYKAELHTHTTCSDGIYTPLECKKLYMQKGFSVVAFTDHDVFVPHYRELSDENFIALNAFELALPPFAEDEVGREKQVHLNFLATNPEIEKMPFYNPNYIYHKGAKEFIGKIPFDGELEIRKNNVEWLNYAIQKGNEQGFLITYNHPVWSVSEPQDYLPLNGLFAMEVWNTSSVRAMPEDGTAWREMLLGGKNVKCVAANDYHFPCDFDAMQAATYLCTNDFSYEGIIKALKAGDFYSSTGPTIEELSVCEGKLYIKCSPVKAIRVFGAKSSISTVLAKRGELLTEAEFPIKPYMKDMFYVHLTDEQGAQAWTNPIFNVGKYMLDVQMEARKEALFLCDKTVNYRWFEEIEDTIAHTYFHRRTVAAQIEEIIALGDEYGFKEIYVQFSASEIIGFDYIFEEGVEEIKRIQSARLQEIENELKTLTLWAKEKNVALVFLSMLPLSHSANVYDYRNSYARAINTLIKRTAENNGFAYVDVSTPLQNEKGILAEQYVAIPTNLTRNYFLARLEIKDNE